MNALVFDNNGNLFIRKESGLEYTFENVDAPALGFEYEMVVYDEDEFKVVEWVGDKPLEEQQQEPLTEGDKELCEQYIANSEPPEGVSLQSQLVQRLQDTVQDHILNMSDNYGFNDFVMVIYAGREGSNHPYRSNARRILEFADAQNTVLDDVAGEIHATREDFLKPFDEYVKILPLPVQLPDQPI